MNINDLYTPEELAEKKITFLKRILKMYSDNSDTFDLAKTVSHKLVGTGANLGIPPDLIALGRRHQITVKNSEELSEVEEFLREARIKIENEVKTDE